MQTRLHEPTSFESYGIWDQNQNVRFRLRSDQCGENQKHKKKRLKTTDFIKWSC